MAAVDSLIRLITVQNADSLTLVSEQVPRLSRAGAAQPLSMPPVGRAMMDMFVGEVITPAQQSEAAAAPLTVDYGEFTATVKKTPAGAWSMTFKKRPARRAPGGASAPPPAPPPAAVAHGASPAPAAPAAPTEAAPAHVASAPPDDASAAMLDRFLRRALDENASDLLISASHGARLRIGGALVDLPGAPFSDGQLHALFDASLTEAHRVHLARHGSADFAFLWREPGEHEVHTPPARFRVNLFRQASGLAAALRPIRRNPPTLAELNLPATLARLARFPSGLVLVTGPTGSGKSSTLVALVEQLNREHARHIVTLEDPIEFEYQSQRSLVHQRELGVHVDSFETGLRAALRESPDVILLGEMRDRATIAAAITAAETGHLVLSSLHAASAPMAVDRVIDAFPEHQQKQVRAQLAGTLRAVLTQHLLPAAAQTPGGRIPAVDLMINTSAVAALIREGKNHQLASAIQTGRDEGMIPLDRSLAELVEARAVGYEAAMALTTDGGLQLKELLSSGAARTRR